TKLVMYNSCSMVKLPFSANENKKYCSTAKASIRNRRKGVEGHGGTYSPLLLSPVSLLHSLRLCGEFIVF
ncbi:MAG: hypothetical protein AABY38_06555, partial [Planctomycetota bacterium]